MNNKEITNFPKINASDITTSKIDGSKYNPKMIEKNKIDILEEENEQLKSQLQQRDEAIGKAIGHINACGKELSNDECRYLLDILNKYKNN